MFVSESRFHDVERKVSSLESDRYINAHNFHKLDLLLEHLGLKIETKTVEVSYRGPSEYPQMTTETKLVPKCKTCGK